MSYGLDRNLENARISEDEGAIMPMSLIVLGGMHNGRRIPIAVNEFLIGRDPTCHLRPSSKEIQWQHCAIVTRDGGAFLRDDSNGNGVFLNRRLLRGGEMQMGDGDLIEVGPLLFRVTMATEEAGGEPTRGRITHRGSHSLTRQDVASDDTRIRAMARMPRAEPPSVTIKPMKDCREIICSY